MTATTAGTVGMMMPADMGGAVSRMLKARGARVVTNLQGRSARTVALAAASGAEDLGDDEKLVSETPVILSVVTPDGAVALAERLAPAIASAGTAPLFVDCNAVSPGTTEKINEIITLAGGHFVDGGIIGNPPRRDPKEARFYLSGPKAGAAARLLGGAVDTHVVGERVGEASAVKMCYAAITKGSFAVMSQLILAAERLGVRETLLSEFAHSQPEQLARLRQGVSASVPKAFRWVTEMEEIGRTFSEVGITGQSFAGAAEIFAAMANTPLGRTRVEDWGAEAPAFEQLVTRLSAEIENAGKSER